MKITNLDEIIEKTDYDTRLALAAWVMDAICKNARAGGSFRNLIYGELGLKTDAYMPLYLAGGQDITNQMYKYEKENE